MALTGEAIELHKSGLHEESIENADEALELLHYVVHPNYLPKMHAKYEVIVLNIIWMTLLQLEQPGEAMDYFESRLENQAYSEGSVTDNDYYRLSDTLREGFLNDYFTTLRSSNFVNPFLP